MGWSDFGGGWGGNGNFGETGVGVGWGDGADAIGGASYGNGSNHSDKFYADGTPKPGTIAPAAPVGPTLDQVLAEYNALLGKARGAGTNYFNSRGITDQTAGEFWNPLQSRTDQAITSLFGPAPTASNYSTYKAPISNDNYLSEAERLAAQSLDAENAAARQLLTGRVNQAFTPYGAETAAPYSMDDEIINSILGEQRQMADDFLGRALSRGQLRAPGYNAGREELGRQGDAGMARLTDIGKGVIDKGRQGIESIKTNALTDAGGFSIGNQFRVDDYTSKAESALSGFKGDLEGQIRNALGGSSVFDPSKAVSFGGAGQGVQNAGSENEELMSAIAAQRKRQTQDRGLNNQGAF